MNDKKNNYYCYRSYLLVLLLTVMVTFAACGSNTVTESTAQSEEEAVQTGVVGNESMETEPVTMVQSQLGKVKLQTKYLVLSYPDTYRDILQHQEVISETVTMEIFSMRANDSVMELFRIYFGDETTGVVAGYLTVEGVEMPVTYTICQYNDEEFVDEDTRALYFETMTCFNEIMDSLQMDERFQSEKSAPPVENTETVLSYWSVTLPETMEYEETEQNGQYKAVFYGNVSGEKIEMYAIYLGNPGGETVLGSYDVNGEVKQLSVESYAITPAEGWTDEEISSAYAMMATVNDVIQTIMSSENFSAEIPEG